LCGYNGTEQSKNEQSKNEQSKNEQSKNEQSKKKAPLPEPFRMKPNV
jgi:hypothetical protein